MNGKIIFIGLVLGSMIFSLNSFLLILGSDSYDFYGYFEIPRIYLILYSLGMGCYFFYLKFKNYFEKVPQQSIDDVMGKEK